MNFKAFDYSRLVQLCTLARPEGQIFLPAAAAKLVQRYSFQKMPTLEQLAAPNQTYTFSVGAFGEYGIHELAIYSNGLVVTAGVNTAVLEAMIADLFTWAESEFGLKDTEIPPRERHYESAIIVEMDVKAKNALPYLDEIAPLLAGYLDGYGNRGFKFDFGAISLAVDTTKYAGTKPLAFTLAKRVSVPFEANIYHSTAPLRTDHHLELLDRIEKLLG